MENLNTIERKSKKKIKKNKQIFKIEIRLTPLIGENDLLTKSKNPWISFKRDRIKVSVKLKRTWNRKKKT
ncbi:translation initiation factor IF-3 C-terminal domain-containing protein [Mycoplasmopsis cynos]|nr:translation initiation factor IF-3 C-terminal domain-containing protein [Mycoplasmopsis cynos]